MDYNTTSPFTGLPDQLTIYTLSFLDKRELETMSCVDKKFKVLAAADSIWESIFKSKFGSILMDAKEINQNWKMTYTQFDSMANKDLQKQFLGCQNLRIYNFAILRFQPKKTLPSHINNFQSGNLPKSINEINQRRFKDYTSFDANTGEERTRGYYN